MITLGGFLYLSIQGNVLHSTFVASALNLPTCKVLFSMIRRQVLLLSNSNAFTKPLRCFGFIYGVWSMKP